MLAISFAALNAQVKLGLKGGVNLANVVGDDVENSDLRIGFHAGALVQVPVIGGFMVQPEAVFSSQGWKSEESGEEAKAILSYVNIPVLAKYRTNSGFFVEAGPQVGFLLSAKAKVGDEKGDIKDGLKTTDFSVALGLGYESNMGIGVNAGYNLGLSTLDEEGEAKVKNSVIQVGVYYLFGGSK